MRSVPEGTQFWIIECLVSSRGIWFEDTPPPSLPIPTSYFKFSFSKACYRKYSDRFVVVLTSNSFAKESERSLYRLQFLPGIAAFFLSFFFFPFLADIFWKEKKNVWIYCCVGLLMGSHRDQSALSAEQVCHGKCQFSPFCV